jgi:hypothetical protein
MSGSAENRKLSLNECKRLLIKNGLQHTDEEIILIRNWFYHLAEIAIDAIDKNAEPISTDAEVTETKNKGKP